MRKLAAAVLAGTTLAVMAVCLTGCPLDLRTIGSGAVQGVADTNNHRVLFYQKPSRTNQAAVVVLGQPDEMSDTANNGVPSASTMNNPAGVAVGPNRQLLVMDTFNCRVLAFQPPFSTGMAAIMTIGQLDGATVNCLSPDSATGSTLRFPTGAAMDPNGNLWVADSGDSRVLKYEPPFASGMAASVALGQTATDSASGSYDCNHANGETGPIGAYPDPTAGTLCVPTRVAFDSSGNLWVVDQLNQRVLMYPPAQQIQGGVATLVIGQSDFVSYLSGTTEAALGVPMDLAFDRHGNLWVSDIANCRVLKYEPPFVNGMAASAALGQTDLISDDCGTSASQLQYPYGLAFDQSGNLAVTDGGNNRTLSFPKSQQITGGSASMVLGQPDLNSGDANQGGSVSAFTQNSPIGVVAYP